MLHAGVGRATLTPPLGTPLVGYGGRERGADAIRDDIYATSLVLSDGDTTVALVTCDLCALPIRQVRYVQRLIEGAHRHSARPRDDQHVPRPLRAAYNI